MMDPLTASNTMFTRRRKGDPSSTSGMVMIAASRSFRSKVLVDPALPGGVGFKHKGAIKEKAGTVFSPESIFFPSVGPNPF